MKIIFIRPPFWFGIGPFHYRRPFPPSRGASRAGSNKKIYGDTLKKKTKSSVGFPLFPCRRFFFILSFEWQRLTSDPGETIAIGSHQRNRLEILF